MVVDQTADVADATASALSGSPPTTHNESRCYSFLSTFLLELLERTKRFTDELLASSIDLLLHSPRRFVRAHMWRLAPLLELALTMGLAYKPLALAALGALERWLADLRPHLRPHLPRLLPRLHAYLTIAVHDEGGLKVGGGSERDAARTRRLASRGQKVAPSTRALARHAGSRSDTELLQQRIVLLLGRAGGECSAIVRGCEGGFADARRWDVVPRVALRVPLRDEAGWSPVPFHISRPYIHT